MKPTMAQLDRPKTADEVLAGQTVNRLAVEYLESMVSVQENLTGLFKERGLPVQVVADVILTALCGCCLTSQINGVTGLDAAWLHRRADEILALPRRMATRHGDGSWSDPHPVKLN